MKTVVYNTPITTLHLHSVLLESTKEATSQRIGLS